MRRLDYFRELEFEMVRAGLWGRRLTRLKEDLHDHLETSIEILRAEGQTPDEAERLALDELGEPSTVARTARCQLAQSSWRSRHWFAGGFLPACIFIYALMAVLLFGGLWLSGVGEYLVTHHRESLHLDFLTLLPNIVNGGVWLAALTLIVTLCVNPSLGWRYSLATSLGLALAASALCVVIQPPVQPGTGYITFCADTWCGLLYKAQYGLRHGWGAAADLGPLRSVFSWPWARFAILAVLPALVYALKISRLRRTLA